MEKKLTIKRQLQWLQRLPPYQRPLLEMLMQTNLSDNVYGCIIIVTHSNNNTTNVPPAFNVTNDDFEGFKDVLLLDNSYALVVVGSLLNL